MSLPFAKMHGAGNDFVMIDGRDLAAGPLARQRIAALCDRRTGVGADGLIVVAPEPGLDFRMIYFNSDGGEAEMCGNGARCSVAFARARGLAGDACRFATASGELDGRCLADGSVEVSLPPWRDLRLDLELPDAGFPALHTCNTGVPHLVIPVADVETVDVAGAGRRLRRHPAFAPAGTNVDWIAPVPDGDEFLLRTYERGVEGETLACGTGASAVAVVLCHLERAASPVRIRTRGGDLLTVTVDMGAGTLHLRGPAVISFLGEVTDDE